MIKHISENTQQTLRTTFEQSLSSPTGFPYCLCFLLPILEISSIFKLLPSAFLNLKVFFFFPLVAFLSLYLTDTWRLQGLSTGHASLSRSHLCRWLSMVMRSRKCWSSTLCKDGRKRCHGLYRNSPESPGLGEACEKRAVLESRRCSVKDTDLEDLLAAIF